MKVFLCRGNKLHGTLQGPYFGAFPQLPILSISPDSLELLPAPVHPASASFKSTQDSSNLKTKGTLATVLFFFHPILVVAFVNECCFI